MNKESKELILKQIEEGLSLRKWLVEQVELLIQISDIIIGTFRTGNKVLLLGNGGSAADAEHFACELSGKFYLNREPLPAVALTTRQS